jgi:Domain of unknown function (DUF4105)
MQRCKKTLFIITLFFCFNGFAQPADNCRIRISLLTCGPGGDLYSIWGHTGVRVIDSNRQADVVFNYGTFNDRDPLFYIKFTRGIMIYSVAPYAFGDFMEEYQIDGRSVTEQVLNLSCAEKTRLSQALWTNVQEENKDYPYHFYADNCTTRARDILLRNIDSTQISFKDIRPQPGTSTYRQLIHSYMNSSTQAWNRLAIDVLLGNHLDEVMNNRQAMFLPDYLMKGLDSASLRQQPLVSQTKLLLPNRQADEGSWFTPVTLFAFLLLLRLALFFLNSATAARAATVFDSIFLLITGFFGLLMLVLWLARVDLVCRNNYNLLWALPSHAVVAFMVQKQQQWLKYYWMITAAINGLLLFCWRWLPQEMNNSLLLVLALLLCISIIRYRKIKKP